MSYYFRSSNLQMCKRSLMTSITSNTRPQSDFYKVSQNPQWRIPVQVRPILLITDGQCPLISLVLIYSSLFFYYFQWSWVFIRGVQEDPLSDGGMVESGVQSCVVPPLSFSCSTSFTYQTPLVQWEEKTELPGTSSNYVLRPFLLRLEMYPNLRIDFT